MGKTRTAVISGKPEQKDKKGVRVPGLKGGEREEKAVSTESDKATARQEKKPKVRGKKYQEAYSKIDKQKAYKIKDAVKLIKQISYSSFDGTLELHAVVKKEGFWPNVTLPHSTGREKKIETVSLKTEKKTPVIHTTVGKISMDGKKLLENLEAVIASIGKKQIVKAYLAATMSPSIKLNLS